MGRSFTGIVRSTFLIGADGRIQQIWDQVKVKDHAAAVLAAAEQSA
jgi:peroxiredoxin Q/BCP